MNINPQKENSGNPPVNEDNQAPVGITHQLKEQLEESIEEIFDIEQIGAEKKQALVNVFTSLIKIHAGPLPDGETIGQYNMHIPHGGERVMALAERQLHHRLRMDELEITSRIRHTQTGQWMGFAIAIAFLGVGAWLIATGHEASGVAIATIDLVALVGVFVLGRFLQKETTRKHPK